MHKVIKTFWDNVEHEAAAREIDLRELATAAGTHPGERVTLDQAAVIQGELNSAGHYIGLDELTNEEA